MRFVLHINHATFNRTSVELKHNVQQNGVVAFLTFNRTSVELKHRRSCYRSCQIPDPFNRTIVELKHGLAVLFRHKCRPFNRTSVELKLAYAKITSQQKPTFNRTIVELKHLQR